MPEALVVNVVVVWCGAALAYAVFLAWYTNRRGPLTAAEIERGMARLEELDVGAVDERAVLRDFFERDDGREFLMLNLVRMQSGPVLDPDTGRTERAGAVMQRYTRPFLRALVRRAGHPALMAFPVGGFVDTWGIDPGPGWTLVGMMRYRSRRDVLELITADDFKDAHRFKHLAMPMTCSFPMGRVRLWAGPRILVALVLALLAALLT
jgi:hypothetical protein